ncbi:MAG: prepilin-type N-terminal cleavage/methylation domain-containing protein [Planctomycetota bacterium]
MPLFRRSAGFTLMELLVSISIFILLGLLLVGLLRSGVEIWDRGETRRDAYERASILFDTLRADLSCSTIHHEADPGGINPNFTCLPDKHGRILLFFTRVGLVPAQGLQAAPNNYKDKDVTFFAAADTMKRYEVVYCFDPDGNSGKLYRGRFDFNADYGMKMPLEPFERTDWIAQNVQLLSDGVIYLGLRFWSQKTMTWNPTGGEPGPELRWDSTRCRDTEFSMKRAAMVANDPLDDILPHRVEITLTLERPLGSGQAVSKLNADIDKNSGTLSADLLRGFPEGPGFVKIEDEWMSYETKSSGALTGVKRGLRGTTRATHKSGARLRWGETFTTVVGVPAFKDDQNP